MRISPYDPELSNVGTADFAVQNCRGAGAVPLNKGLVLHVQPVDPRTIEHLLLFSTRL